MRAGRVDFGNSVEPAVQHQGFWVHASACGPSGKDADVLDLLARADEIAAELAGLDVRALAEAGNAVPLDGARLALPLVGPRAVVAVGLNYREHADEVIWEAPPTPLLFAKWPSALTGPHDPIPVDAELSTQVDHEVELAAIIGRPTRDVDAASALRHVAGYAVANDVSARDVQAAESQWTRAKSFDGFCPIGPWVTSADEVPDPQRLSLSCTVNGERRQHSTTAQMIHTVADLIAFVSRGMTLMPGDVVLTGTPAGVAMGSPSPQWLRPGDEVVCEIEMLGRLRNVVVDRAAR
jgi:2-keto-4-pentenoate hydratase/2-oxohepta-3-ene-1,7-dioic acid hydratase in catechol pathway